MTLGLMSHYILAKSTVSTHAKFIMLKGISSDDMYISNIIRITIYGFISLMTIITRHSQYPHQTGRAADM